MPITAFALCAVAALTMTRNPSALLREPRKDTRWPLYLPAASRLIFIDVVKVWKSSTSIVFGVRGLQLRKYEGAGISDRNRAEWVSCLIRFI